MKGSISSHLLEIFLRYCWKKQTCFITYIVYNKISKTTPNIMKFSTKSYLPLIMDQGSK